MKIGRNEPCPCGSGKKYKKCCLNKPGKTFSMDHFQDAGNFEIKPIFDEDSEPGVGFDSLDKSSKQQLVDYINKLHMKWADEFLPELDGEKPRKAVQSESGRQRVIQLIRENQNLDEEFPSLHKVKFDYNLLRRELGLPEE